MTKSNLRIASILSIALISCRPAQDPAGQNEGAKTEPKRPVLPVAEQPLVRAGLLMAVARAASASALGQDDREAQRKLDGDRFELRLRFGCGGATNPAQPERRRWTLDEQQRVIRFRVEPDFAGDLPMIESLAGADFESVEGFWIRRPWLLDAGCPILRREALPAEPADAPAPVEPRAPPATSGRIGIAQFFTGTDARTHRRANRAYEATKILKEKEAPSAQGYDLVLEGRLRALPSGRVIACSAVQADASPECIVSAGFDRVRIERPDTRAVVAEWGGA